MSTISGRPLARFPAPRWLFALLIVGLLLSLTPSLSALPPRSAPQADTAPSVRVPPAKQISPANFGQLPVAFVPSASPTEPSAGFTARTLHGVVAFLAGGLTLHLPVGAPSSAPDRPLAAPDLFAFPPAPSPTS